MAKPKIRQRRRVDGRVKELEKEVRALRSLLKTPDDTTQEKHPENPIEYEALGIDESTFAALPTMFANITAGDSQSSLYDRHQLAN